MFFIPLVPLILLWARYTNFLKLTASDLPDLKDDDFQQMRKLSLTSCHAIEVGTIASWLSNLLPWFHIYLPLSIAFVAVMIAATFDLKAERIKIRGIPVENRKNRDDLRFYHILVGLLLPPIGLVWGTFNLARRKNSSGLWMFCPSLAIVVWWVASLLAPIIFR